MKMLDKWCFGFIIPVVLVFTLGWMALALGEKVSFIAWYAVALPIAWSVVALVIILNLRPDGRLLAKKTFRPFLFFALWYGSIFSTGRILPYFPHLGSGTNSPSIRFIKNINLILPIVVTVVVFIFIYQCWQDKRKKRIY